MALSTLADILYTFYLFINYFLKSCAFVGSLLFDIACHVFSTTRWLIENGHALYMLVYEDNHYLIQDVKAIGRGTADFVVNNIVNAYTIISYSVTKIAMVAAALFTFTNVIFVTIKQSLLLIGESVWFLFTLPAQVVTILRDISIHLADQLEDGVNALFRKCLDTKIALVHYITHDVPLEALCGLILLLAACTVPGCSKTVMKLFVLIAAIFYHLLCSLQQRAVRFGVLIKNKARRFVDRWSEYILLHQQYITIVQLCINIHAHAASVYDGRVRPVLNNIFNMFVIKANAQPSEVADTRNRRHATPNDASIGLCIICADNDRSVAFVPCGHICVCKVCSVHLCYHNPVCPLCRSYIQQKLEIYI